MKVLARGRGAAAILAMGTALGALWSAGCGSSGSGGGDGGNAPDVIEPSDAGGPDAGGPTDADADAAPSDAGKSSADAASDASESTFDADADAAPSDASESTSDADAAPSDATESTPDAAQNDATVSDAGSDAGSPEAGAESGAEAPVTMSCHWGFRTASEFQSDAGMFEAVDSFYAVESSAHADLNGDGKEDLVWVSQTEGGSGGNLVGALEAMLGNGDGTFGPAASFTVEAAGFGAFVIGDVNGDGKLDAVVPGSDSVAQGSALDVLLGNGDGTFRPYVGTGGSSMPGGYLTLGDVNGDGKTDVVLGNPTTGVDVFLGNGDGSFQTPLPVGTEPEDVGPVGPVVVADFNGDDKPDLVLPAASLDVRLGNGDGTFGAPTLYGGNLDPSTAVVGDWNGDGKPDIACSGSNTLLFILLGNGDGTFHPGMTLSGTSPPPFVQSLRAADVDRNGTQDLVVFVESEDVPDFESAQNGDLIAFLGNGDGTFQGPQLFPCGADSNGLTGSFELADFDGDGYADALCLVGNGPATASGPGSQSSTSFFLLLGDRSGAFRQTAGYAAPSPLALAAGDLNGDGKPDLVTANGQDGGTAAGVSVLIGSGLGDFAPAVGYAAGADPVSVALSDLNRDGHLDAVVANGGAGTVSVLLGGGDGTLGAPTLVAVGANPSFVAVGDLNGDHKPDLVVANAPQAADAGTPAGNVDTVSVLLGVGDGTFEAQTTYAVGGDPVSLALSDFNGDGHLDVTVANEGSTTVGILLGNGDGTLGAPVSYATALQPVSVAAGDVNGDGKVDLAVANSGANSVSVLYGNGDGTFQTQMPFATGSYVSAPNAVAIADVDGDGTPDLLAADPNETTLDVLHGNGDGTFAAPGIVGVGAGPDALALADFDNDGALDVAVGSAGASSVSVLLACPAGSSPGAGTPAASGGSVTVTPSSLAFFDGCGSPFGPTPDSLAITVTNPGASPVVLDVSASEPGPVVRAPYTTEWFAISLLGETDGVLGAGQSATVLVTPTTAAFPTTQDFTGTIAIRSGGNAGGTQTVTVTESLVGNPIIEYEPDVDFGDVAIGNSVSHFFGCPGLAGIGDLGFSSAPGFSATGDCQYPTFGFTVTFAPLAVGTQTVTGSTLVCTGSATFTITGTGVAADAGADD